MMKKLMLIGLFSTCVLLFSQTAVSGEIDLAGWDLDSKDSVTLHGEWEFYFNKYFPEDFKNESVQKHADIRVPENWLDVTDENGNPVYPMGIGTYRLVIKNMPATRVMGLKFDSLNNAAAIFWNGRLVKAVGVVGKDRETAVYDFDKSVIRLPLVRSENELVVQVSNYHDRTAGIISDVHIGTWEGLVEKRNRSMVIDYLIFGVFISMGLYHLFVFIFRTSQKVALFFSFLCFTLATRMLFINELGIEMMMPLSWSVLLTINYLSLAFILVFFLLYLYYQFKDDNNKFLLTIFTGCGLIYAGITGIGGFFLGFEGVKLYTEAFIPFVAVIVVSIIYSVIVLINAMRHRRKGSVAFFFIFLGFAFTAVNDLLYHFSRVEGANLLSFGLLGFVVFQAFLMNRQFAHALMVSKNLSAELQAVNVSMQRFVPKAFLGLLEKEKIYDVQLGDNSKQEMTVLFADIRNFTGMSESMSSEEVFAFLNSFLAIMGPIIRNHGGFVDKYMGDGIMALFPESTEGAVAAAVEMKKALPVFNSEWLEKINTNVVTEIDMGIGIHYGALMLGTIGEQERMDGTVISDAVNLSSRLQELTKKLKIGILISKSAYHNLEKPDDFWFRNIGKVSIRGKKKQVTVYEVFSADPEALQQRKLQSLEDFEQGKYYLMEGNSAKAMSYLQKVSELLPGDKVVEQYLVQASGGINRGGL